MAFLFVNSDAQFNSRIKTESGSKALIAESLLQGAEMVMNQNSCFKAIYVNPNDSSFSALEFLDLCVRMRPGTPVYLIDQQSEIHSTSLGGILSQHHIHGIFSQHTSFQDFSGPLWSISRFHRSPSKIQKDLWQKPRRFHCHADCGFRQCR